MGPSGFLLTQMLNEAGINRVDCFLTNVINQRPPDNDFTAFCCPKSEDQLGFPPVFTGCYLRREFLPELNRLASELRREAPNLIITTGNVPTWALLGSGNITKLRGTIAAGTSGPVGSALERCGIIPKVLPTIHPAAIIRQWKWRAVTVLDFAKARREAEFPEILRPERQIFIAETLDDLEWFYDRYIDGATLIAPDIETSGDQITCIGFAVCPQVACVVPFVDNRRADRSYWPSHKAELHAWRFVQRVLHHPARKIFQNGMYDIAFLWRRYGLTVRNPGEDTMLMHHALQPESKKDLGFLGSVYTNEPAWKMMRQRGKATIKRDD